MVDFNGAVFLKSRDLHFNYVAANEKAYQIRVARECLEDEFGSDAGESALRETLGANIDEILAIAEAKIAEGEESPVISRAQDVS
jgi:hypothetical protein